MGHYLLSGQPYSWVSCSWSMPYRGRAAGSGSVQTDYHQFLGVTTGRSGGSAGRKARGHAEVLKVPQSFARASKSLQTWAVGGAEHGSEHFPCHQDTGGFVVVFFSFVCVVFFSLESIFFLKMRFCDRVKLWIHANTEYANIPGVFCMFQLLTAFIMGLLLE